MVWRVCKRDSVVFSRCSGEDLAWGGVVQLRLRNGWLALKPLTLLGKMLFTLESFVSANLVTKEPLKLREASIAKCACG